MLMINFFVHFFYLLQKGQGAPGREPQLTDEQQKQMMLYYHRRQEEMKVSKGLLKCSVCCPEITFSLSLSSD